MIMDQNVDLGPNAVRRYIIAYVSSNTGTDEADLIETTRKAWKYAFGWDEFVTNDSIPDPAVVQYPFYAIGTHEGGLSSGCNGCVFSEVEDDSNVFSFTSNGCQGTITLNATMDDRVYKATYRVATPCGGYWEDCDLEVVVGEPVNCSCPFQGDINSSGFRDAVDLNLAIDLYFFNGADPQDPLCPTRRSDFNGDGFGDSVDLSAMIGHLFFNGPDPCDPCYPLGGLCP